MPGPTSEEVTSQYLYGSATPPSNLLDDSLIRPPLAPNTFGATIPVDVVWYMQSSGGRFALGPLSDVVKYFFEPPQGAPPLSPNTYT